MLFVFGALALVGGASGSADKAVPRVLVRVGTLDAFAQDGPRIVWADSSAGGPRSCAGAVKLRNLRTGKTFNLYRGTTSDCGALLHGFQDRMALAGTRALWALVFVGNTVFGFELEAASPSTRLRHVDGGDIQRGLGSDDAFVPVPIAGDGPTLVYADISDALDYQDPGYRYVHRIDRSKVAGTYGTMALAASGGSFAVAREGGSDSNWLASVEIRDTKSGKIRSHFVVDGIVDDTTELALDARHVALLNPASSDRLEIRTRAGQLWRTIPLPSDASDVSLSGRWAVYLTQGRIRALDITNGSTRTLAIAKGNVVGLSIEGTRVAWGEQRRGSDVILALDLP